MKSRSSATVEIVEQSKQLLAEHGVMTLRHLYYLLISAGTIQNSMKSYQSLVRIIGGARRRGEIAYSSLVDGTRSTVKPGSWSGLAEFSDTVREAYRKDLWQQQKEYIELWCEKDAIVGVIEEVTSLYDVMTRPLRGYSSLTFIYHAARDLNQIKKPSTIYYLGYDDPSGYDIERSSRESLSAMLNKPMATARSEFTRWAFGREFVGWERLAITGEDIRTHVSASFPGEEARHTV